MLVTPAFRRAVRKPLLGLIANHQLNWWLLTSSLLVFGGLKMAKIRLVDIAEKIDVSTVTVYNALSGNKGVSNELRSKIQNIAEEMGYNLPTDKKQKRNNEELHTIGVIVAENYLAQYETFYWKIYQELAMSATEKTCFTTVEVLKKNDEIHTLKMPACVVERRVEGLIVLGEINKSYIAKLKKVSDIPIVFLDFYDIDLATDAVVADNFYGMFALTEFMFNQGIDEIGFVGSIFATCSIMDRYCGFMKSMMLHGKNLNPEWLIEDRDKLGQMDIKLPNNLPKGLACNCDLAAFMIMEKLKERGIRVPDDISIVGFDNYLYPGLADLQITTYDVNTKTMAKVALDKVIKQIKNPKRGHGLDVVSGQMVIKKTVKLAGN